MLPLPESNQEATQLMLRMRTLIHLEFKIQLKVTQAGIERQLCAYGFKSQSSELLEKAKQLAKIAAIPLPDKLKGINNILELLASDLLKNPVRISAAGISAFVIDKSHNRFWSASSLKRLNKLGEIDIDFINIEPLSDEEIMDLEQKQRLFQTSVDQTIPMRRLPLDGFFWFVSARFSQGQLLNKLTLLKRVRLTRWPEICRQVGYRTYTRMAVQLMQHPSSIPEFTRAQGNTSEIEAIIFLNACYLCGWLIEVQEPLMVKQNDTNQKIKLNFISRIRAKLGIGTS